MWILTGSTNLIVDLEKLCTKNVYVIYLYYYLHFFFFYGSVIANYYIALLLF